MRNDRLITLKLSAAVVVDGLIVRAGQLVEMVESEAKDLLRRGKAVLATERDESALRTDGPTVAEYVAAGYRAENYPPQGYESRSTAEEIQAAIEAQAAAADGTGTDDAPTVARSRARSR